MPKQQINQCKGCNKIFGRPVPNVYQLNDCDLWAGHDFESVKQAYLKNTGICEDEGIEDPYELSGEELDSRMHGGDPDANEPGYPRTFRQELYSMVRKGLEFPCFFASTKY